MGLIGSCAGHERKLCAPMSVVQSKQRKPKSCHSDIFRVSVQWSTWQSELNPLRFAAHEIVSSDKMSWAPVTVFSADISRYRWITD